MPLELLPGPRFHAISRFPALNPNTGSDTLCHSVPDGGQGKLHSDLAHSRKRGSKMRANLMTAVKGPLEARDVLDPEPGPGQVRIRLHASGVCGTDVHVWNGELPVPLPIVLGHEPVGVMDVAGPGVHSVKVGDRVGVSWFQAGCGRCSVLREETIQILCGTQDLDHQRRRLRRIYDR